jgi:hypothetical protein
MRSLPFVRLRRKPCVIAVLVIAAAVGLALYFRPTRLVLGGYARFEPCYRGLPARYWADAVKRYHDEHPKGTRRKPSPRPADFIQRYISRTPQDTDYVDDTPAIMSLDNRVDRRLTPVLLVFLRDGDPRLRRLAVLRMHSILPRPTEAIEPLRLLLDDKTPWFPDDSRATIGDVARTAIIEIDPAYAAKIGLSYYSGWNVNEAIADCKRSLDRNPNDLDRLFVVRHLYVLSHFAEKEQLRDLVPTLRSLSGDTYLDLQIDDKSTGQIARELLARIE